MNSTIEKQEAEDATELLRKLEQACEAPVLLVAADYDGTLAPIVSDPANVQTHPEAVVALRSLAAMDKTHVAVISGRSLGDLGKHLKDLDRVHFIGSHGSEFEAGFASPLPPEKLDLLGKVEAESQRISAKTSGTTVEKKPAGIAFHYRNADEHAATAAVNELLNTATAKDGGVFVRRGKKVVELSVVKTDKGEAIKSLRQRIGASLVIFIGDDVTDEDAFAALTGPDIGIKVGDGPTAAKYRVKTTLDAARALAGIAEKRSAWLAGAKATPINKYSMLSDQRTCALIGPDGRLSWLCLPRIDSAAMFAEILGGPTAGFFEIRPISATTPAKQTYLGDTFVLESDWGNLRVTDYLDCSAGRPTQRAGRADLIRMIEGRGRVRVTFAPRNHFGSVETRLAASKDGLTVDGCIEPCVLAAWGIQWTITEEGGSETAVAEFDVNGDPVVLELRYGTLNMGPAANPQRERREQTEKFWTDWTKTLKLPSVRPDLVLRSALVLRALCYGPTGAIAAAATTSLPESVGGVRNWDYRFCWPRDGSLAATALLRLGAAEPGMKLLEWMLDIVKEAEPDALIRPVYTITGGHMGPEGDVTNLSGYRGSRPVRVGNVAAHQVQLDVLGPIAELILLLAQHGISLPPEHWRITESMVAAVGKRWRDKDHGIWEIRGPRKHNLHSKVMCWQTVNCGLQIAEILGHRRTHWAELRQEISQEVLSQGWNQQKKAFCASYGSSEIDASALSVGLSGLLAPDDERFVSTVTAIERELRDGPTVYRYRYDDGLPGVEGGFNLCTSWLIEAYAMLRRTKDAEELFDRYVGLAGPTGLISEEYDPRHDMALGNYPQAYSHIGLISAALRLAGSSKIALTAQK